MFYTYRQNNSGGSFHHDAADGISVNVIVEADSAKQADTKAQAIGLYFNGVESGDDCECCGDRWSTQWNDEEGTTTPQVYGEEVTKVDASDRKWMGKGTPEIYVHYADGRVEGFRS